MPKMGNETFAGEAGVCEEATLAGLLARRDVDGFFFMRLFPALPESGEVVGATLPDGDANDPTSGFFLIQLEFPFHSQQGHHVRLA